MKKIIKIIIHNICKTKIILKSQKLINSIDLIIKLQLLIFFSYIIINNIKKIQILLKGKKFIENCSNGLLMNNNKNNNYKIMKPILSAIIPVYNCEKTIKASIRSIQNQNISEIEIILVNDFSKDNSLKIIKQLKKEDQRIILINNNKNMGTLYSRCIGVLISKGDYIFSLDDDDMFFDEDVFHYIYTNAKMGDFEIISFKSLCIKNFNYGITKMKECPFSNHPNGMILRQPDLGTYPIKKVPIYNDIHIWAKCIKSQVYKKGVISLGKKRYSTFMSWAEDTSMIFILFNIAKSFKFISKYGVIHLLSNLTASSTQSRKNKIFGELFLLDIIYDYSKNNSDKNLAIYYALYIQKKRKFKKIKYNKNFKYLHYILKKILNCKYISMIDKEKLKKKFNFFNLK